MLHSLSLWDPITIVLFQLPKSDGLRVHDGQQTALHRLLAARLLLARKFRRRFNANDNTSSINRYG